MQRHLPAKVRSSCASAAWMCARGSGLGVCGSGSSRLALCGNRLDTRVAVGQQEPAAATGALLCAGPGPCQDSDRWHPAWRPVRHCDREVRCVGLLVAWVAVGTSGPDSARECACAVKRCDVVGVVPRVSLWAWWVRDGRLAECVPVAKTSRAAACDGVHEHVCAVNCPCGMVTLAVRVPIPWPCLL